MIIIMAINYPGLLNTALSAAPGRILFSGGSA